MADVLIFAIAIASAVSLLIVSPREAQRKALRALRTSGETEALATSGHAEDFAGKPGRQNGLGAMEKSELSATPYKVPTLVLNSRLENVSNQLILNAPSGVAGK